jgi:hypothetical protein
LYLCSAMTKTLSSTAVYAYTTLISMIVCLPFAIGMEGPQLQAGAAAAIAKVRQRLCNMACIIRMGLKQTRGCCMGSGSSSGSHCNACAVSHGCECDMYFGQGVCSNWCRAAHMHSIVASLLAHQLQCRCCDLCTGLNSPQLNCSSPFAASPTFCVLCVCFWLLLHLCRLVRLASTETCSWWGCCTTMGAGLTTT